MHAGQLVDNRFLLLQRADGGGMGTVWRAKDCASDTTVALKALRDPEAGKVSRFLHEARILAQLQHAHIVRHVGHGIAASGEPYIAMEWLEGENLAERLARGPLSLKDSLELVRRVAAALSAAHARGIIHRDIKPSNLFLPGRDVTRVKLLDFGIARLAAISTALTSTNQVLGTPGYIAPEQARGDTTIGPAADVFSLGCVLFECLSGRPAFIGAHPMALLAKLLLEEPPSLDEICRDIPLAVTALTGGMLSKTPSARPPNGEALLAALSSLDHEAPTSSPRSAAPSRISRSERRHLSIVALRPQRATIDPAATTLSLDSLAQHAATPLSVSQTHRNAIEVARRLAARFGGRVDILADRTILVILLDGNPTEQASRAGRLALALCEVALRAPIALVSGRSDWADRLPVGELVERAAVLLERARNEPEPAVFIDEETRALVKRRFGILPRGELLALGPEHWNRDDPRKLLGKPSPFVGRERELSNLVLSLEEGFEEPSARILLVTAPPGMGKSRLRLELVRSIRQRFPAMAYAIGRADPLGGGAAFSLIASALRSAMGIEAGEPAEVGRQKILSAVLAVLPPTPGAQVAEFLGELLGEPFPDDESPLLRSARRDAVVMAQELQGAFVAFTRALARKSPVVLVLEDLHWGDASSVKLVDMALRELHDEAFAVVAFARPDVHEVFPRAWAGRGAQEIRLGPLSKKASESLVRTALGDDVNPERVAQILARAEGNAFYLEELIRAVQEGRGDELPVTVLGMVEARLSALPPDARRVLRAASVFGQVFWVRGVLALLGKDVPRNFDDIIDFLIEHELIGRRNSRRFADVEEFSFRHGLVHEVAYAMLTGWDKITGHRLAGAWLERMGEPEPWVLAMHFERGRQKGKAALLHARAAERAMRGNDLPAAVASIARGLAAGPDDQQVAADLWALRARLEATAGNVDRTLVAAEEALRLARQGSVAYCMALEGAISSAMLLGRTEAVRAYIGILPAIEPEAGAVSALARAFAPTVTALAASGRARSARQLLDRLKQIMAGRMDQDPSGAGSLAYASANWEFYVCRRPSMALRYGADAIRYLSLGGEGHIVRSVRAHLAYFSVWIGAFEEAKGHIESTLAEAAPGSMATTVARTALSRLLFERGELDEARAVASRMLEDRGDRRENVLDILTQFTLVDACISQGDLGEAARILGVLDSLAPTIPICGPMAWMGRAGSRLAEGRAAAAIDAIERASRSFDELEVVAPERLLLTRAEAMVSMGERRATKRAIAAARDELVARAALIPDASHRTSFLERVPVNARILALAKEWLDDAPGSK